MSKQITVTIPEGIEPPQFSMFQKVRYNDDQGVVVGIEHVGRDRAVATGREVGWLYVVEFPYSPTGLLEAEEPAVWVEPDEIEAIE